MSESKSASPKASPLQAETFQHGPFCPHDCACGLGNGPTIEEACGCLDCGAPLQAETGAMARPVMPDELTRIAGEIYRAWDTDRDSRVGKLLAALAGSQGYRADIDALRAALGASAEGIGTGRDHRSDAERQADGGW